MARLQAVFGKDRQVTSGAPLPIDPQLAHYLQRHSYDKTLEFVEGKLGGSSSPLLDV